MIRLGIWVEGLTEMEFVKNILVDRLRTSGVEAQLFDLRGNVTVTKLACHMARLYWSYDCVTRWSISTGFAIRAP